MNNNPPGITKCRSAPSTVDTVKDSERNNAIKEFINLYQLLKSTLKPLARTFVFQNADGDCVATTSSIGRMIPHLSKSEPLVKFFLTAIEIHVDSFKDGGTFAALIGLKMICSSVELGIHRRIVSEIYDELLPSIMMHIDSGNFKSVKKLDLDDLASLMSLSRGVFRSNSSLMLSSADVEHLSELVVEGFLKSLQSTGSSVTFGTIKYATVEGGLPLQSHIVQGLLYEMPHMSVMFSKVLGSVTDGNSIVEIVLYGVSLSGDSEEFVDITHEVTHNPLSKCSPSTQLFDSQRIISALKDLGVRLLACQKVIHPSLKRACLNHGILPLERLGGELAKSFEILTGCTPINLADGLPTPSNIGSLGDISPMQLSGKHYLNLTRNDSSVNTVVLFQGQDEMLVETKLCCETAQHVLMMTIADPCVIEREGEWLVEVGEYIRRHARAETQNLTVKFECSKTTLHRVADNLAQCLQVVAGIYSEESCPPALYCFSARKKALYTAIKIASTLLNVNLVITDTN